MLLGCMSEHHRVVAMAGKQWRAGELVTEHKGPVGWLPSPQVTQAAS